MFEQEIKTHFTKHNIAFNDWTRSHSLPDFFLPGYNLWFDAKEKAQAFSKQNWGKVFRSTEHLFILDDLAVRRLLKHGPKSFCLIKDSSHAPHLYYVYSLVDLLCMPKRRVRRPIERNLPMHKGKWLVDLRDAAAFDSLPDALAYLLSYDKLFPAIFQNHLDCWGNYPSEQITEAGTKRTAKFWNTDASSHA